LTKARVIGDAGETDKSIVPDDRLGKLRRIANVTMDHLQVRIALGQKVIAIVRNIVARHLIAAVEQPWDENGAHIARSSGYEYARKFVWHFLVSSFI
jgi:hypothetical protein